MEDIWELNFSLVNEMIDDGKIKLKNLQKNNKTNKKQQL